MYDLCFLRQVLLDVKKIEEILKKESSLSLNEALCLCQHGNGFTDPSSLARELSLSPSRMTRILDSLTKKGYISRTESDGDRRSVTITMSQKGLDCVKKLHSISLDLPQYLIDLAEQAQHNN